MVMTRENISCVTAQAKVGKTFLVKLILSAVLKGVFQNRLVSNCQKIEIKYYTLILNNQNITLN